MYSENNYLIGFFFFNFIHIIYYNPIYKNPSTKSGNTIIKKLVKPLRTIVKPVKTLPIPIDAPADILVEQLENSVVDVKILPTNKKIKYSYKKSLADYEYQDNTQPDPFYVQKYVGRTKNVFDGTNQKENRLLIT